MKLQKSVFRKNTLIIDGNYKFIQSNILKLTKKISDNGSIFVLFQNQYNNNNDLRHDFLDIIDLCLKQKLFYVNTIVYPTKHYSNNSNHDNIGYIIWLSKTNKNYIFNKDKIREKSIWKDIEWGKRSKNYNPKGKDPGNVWIPTNDDGKGHITKHLLLSKRMIIKRIVKLSCVSDSDCVYVKQSNNFKDSQKFNEQLYKPTSSLSQNYTNDAKVYFTSSEKMNFIKNNSLACVVTSPPYWDLKDYFKKGQIGQESYQKYLGRLNKVWCECYKKLNKNGFLWININIRKKQNLPILIPHEIKLQCKKIGFHYKGIAIWHKSSGIPVDKFNLKDNHEYVLFFSKDKNACLNSSSFKQICDYKNDKINNGLFWNINRKAGSVGKKYIHPAIFPINLPSRCILLCTNPSDIVLDPFLGSGTTIIASLNLGRKAIGIEFNDIFKPTIIFRAKNEVKNYKSNLIKYIKK